MSKFEALTPKLETNKMKAQSEIRSSNELNPEHKTELNRSEFFAFSRLRFIWMLFVSDFVLRISICWRLFRIGNSKFHILAPAGGELQ